MSRRKTTDAEERRVRTIERMGDPTDGAGSGVCEDPDGCGSNSEGGRRAAVSKSESLWFGVVFTMIVVKVVLQCW